MLERPIEEKIALGGVGIIGLAWSHYAYRYIRVHAEPTEDNIKTFESAERIVYSSLIGSAVAMSTMALYKALK
jgi:hypothetical protein